MDSLEKLEIVVALHRAPAGTSSPAALAATLQLEPELAAVAIADLARANVVESAGGLTRLVRAGEDGAAIDELVALYDQDRLMIMRAMSTIALEKIRGMAARAFADAFHFRKKKDGEDG